MSLKAQLQQQLLITLQDILDKRFIQELQTNFPFFAEWLNERYDSYYKPMKFKKDTLYWPITVAEESKP